MKPSDLFNKILDRNDMAQYTIGKDNPDNIFDDIVGEFKDHQGTRWPVHLTNDPIKMLGCGFRIKSSYSPESESFKYLPSFVLQDYIGMLYIPSGAHYFINRKDEQIIAPDYKVRAFVMINPQSKKILYKMPVYTDDNSLYGAFDKIECPNYGYLVSDTKAPEIHLDVLKLFRAPNTKGGYPKRHVALCGRLYPCKEQNDMYELRLLAHKRRAMKRDSDNDILFQ